MEIQVPNFRSAISTILRTGNGVMLANRFIYDADSDQLINFGIDNTCSKLIIVWAEDPKDPQTTSFCNFMASEYVPRGERGR